MGEVGEVVHVFTHLRVRMWVERFLVEGDGGEEEEEEEEVGKKVGKRKGSGEEGEAEERKVKWVETSGVEGETLSTGMRRCWGLVGVLDIEAVV